MSSFARSAGDGGFGLGVVGALAPDRRECDGACPRAPEDLDAPVYGAYVDESTRDERVVIEGRAIGPKRAFLLHAHREVGPVSRVERPFCESFEVENVDRVLR